MKPHEQRIAIAEACGWTWKQGNHADFLWHDPQDRSHSSFCKERSELGCIADLPDYLNDLNAMHKAENVLTDEQHSEYRGKLLEISSTVSSKTLRHISYPHREWLEPAIPVGQPYYPRKYTDKTRTGLFHTFAVEGSAGDELVVVAVIEAEDGSIVTPIASKCQFLDRDGVEKEN